jgi:hypothetical protein
MCSPLANIEPVARAICTREFAAQNNAAEIPALVDRYWRVTAALLEAGLIGDDGRELPHNLEAGEAAWADWLVRHKDRPHQP